MEVLTITILTSMIIIFVTLYVLLHKEIKSITCQLNKINSTKTNSKVLLSLRDKNLEKLALEINKTLEEKRKTETEYKKIDLELRQAIANMSHDLRTPLTSIMGYIQLIEDESLPIDEKKEYMDIVKKRAKSLQALITSFYDLSRLEAKEYKFEFKSLSLPNILCDIIASFYNDFINTISAKSDITLYDLLITYFEYWYKNREFLKKLVDNNVYQILLDLHLKYLNSMATDENFKDLTFVSNNSYFNHFSAGGLWFALKRWVEDDTEKTPKEMTDIILNFYQVKGLNVKDMKRE